MRILVTGVAGFIGSHVAERLVAAGHRVTGIDNFDPFYPEEVKRRNVEHLLACPEFELIEADVLDARGAWTERVVSASPDVVVHLAARAGVRPSILQPAEYVRANVEGTASVLELARRCGSRGFVLGSSSSVYGNSARVPFSEDDPASHPVSPYAATKRAAELLCHTHHHLYGLSIVCLRFFTVYGPRQRPDLAIHKFARLVSSGEPIPVYGDGSTERDYTFISDIVQGVMAAVDLVYSPPHRFEILNLGGSRTIALRTLVELLGGTLGVTPRIDWRPAQPGDVVRTFADLTRSQVVLGYTPSISFEDGIARFVEWFRARH